MFYKLDKSAKKKTFDSIYSKESSKLLKALQTKVGKLV